MTTQPSMPSNIEAEQAVLGGILLDPASVHRVAAILSASDFYSDRHGWIYDALRALANDNTAIDFTTVINALSERGKLKEIGGAAYLTTLCNATPTALNVEHHALIVKNLSTRRNLIRAAGEIASAAYDERTNISAMVAQAQSVLLKAMPSSAARAITSADSVANVIQEFRLRADAPSEIVGMRSGLPDWDDKFGGFQTGLYVLAGQTSHGKTAVTLALADGIASYGKRGVYISLEMTERQIAYRRLARYCGISSEELQTGYIRDGSNGARHTRRTFTSPERKMVEEAAMKIADLPLVFRNEFSITSAQVRAILTEEKWRRGLDFAIVDYLHLLADEGDDVRALGDATKNLKHTADDLDIPIILLAQVHRGVESRNNHLLTLSDIRGSGRIEENADVIFGITNQDNYHLLEAGYQKKNILDVYGLKDRLLGRAAGRAIQLRWVERTGAVQSMTTDRQGDTRKWSP